MRAMEALGRTLLVAVGTAVVLWLVTVRAQQSAAPAPGSPTPGLNDRCGGRSQKPTEACPTDVTRMMATLALLPDKPPATPQKPRKVLIWSRIPSSGFQHSAIPAGGKAD